MTVTIAKLPLFVFNTFEAFWNKKRTQAVISGILATVFLGGLLAIDLNRRGMLPEPLNTLIPLNHFQAVTLAFYLLLIVEIIGLILVMASSMSRSVSKELEILALIMLRNAFKALGEMQEPIDPSLDILAISGIAANCVAAIIIFLCNGIYERVQQASCPMPGGETESPIYIGAKKYTALVLLTLFFLDGFSHIGALITGKESLAAQASFFARFYTMLIFADLFMLLASEGATHKAVLLFRNSGYTAGALFMRMALGAPHFWDAGLGIFAAVYIVGVSYAVKRLRIDCKYRNTNACPGIGCKNISPGAEEKLKKLEKNKIR